MSNPFGEGGDRGDYIQDLHDDPDITALYFFAGGPSGDPQLVDRPENQGYDGVSFQSQLIGDNFALFNINDKGFEHLDHLNTVTGIAFTTEDTGDHIFVTAGTGETGLNNFFPDLVENVHYTVVGG